MINKSFKKRRIELASKLKDNSILIMASGSPVKKSSSAYYDFLPNLNFYYLTGIKEENNILVLMKTDDEIKEYIYINENDEHKIKWVGAYNEKREVKLISEINDISFNKDFDNEIESLLKNKIIYLDLENNDERSFGFLFMRKYHLENFIDITDNLKRMRMIKDKEEIALIKKAIDITHKGFEEIWGKMKDGLYEYQLEAYFDYALKFNGSTGHAFKSIIASAKNACILHYEDNKCMVSDNSLVLVDVGAQYDLYKADITRTFPINGRFNKRQKELYEIVLDAQNEVIGHIKPGVTIKELNEILIEFYYQKLKAIKLIENKEEVSKYYYHNVSHHLGLETHDVYLNIPLEVGNVITVEPGLYIEEEEIGIRIEDDILITKDGCEILSIAIPKKVKELEKEHKKNQI